MEKGPPPPNGELCDGLDNDGNGKIDDADIEHDGVWDCLRIATLGEGGASSSGLTVLRNWPNGGSQNPVVALGDKDITDELLAPFDVIVVLHVATMPIVGNRTVAAHHTFSNDEVGAFERWVSAGGAVMTTIGYSSQENLEVGNVNRLLAPFGMAYSPTKLDVNGYVETWLDHPITKGVKRIYTEDGVQPDGPAARTLAQDLSGRVSLQVPADDTQRIIVWGDEWITYDTEWQKRDDQQVERFWLNSLAWMSGAATYPVALPE